MAFDFNEAAAWKAGKKLCFSFYEFELRPVRECEKCRDYPRCKSETFTRRNEERLKRV